MKKIISIFAVFCAAGVLMAAAPAKAANPIELMGKKHVWYRLSATGNMKRQADGAVLLTLKTPKAPWGDIGYSKKITVKPGEKLTITVEAKGTGSLSYGIRLDKAGNCTKTVKLTDKPQKFTTVFDFAKLQKKLPQKGMFKVILPGGTPNAKAVISSFSYTLTK